jgi:hypothetical protein
VYYPMDDYGVGYLLSLIPLSLQLNEKHIKEAKPFLSPPCFFHFLLFSHLFLTFSLVFITHAHFMKKRVSNRLRGRVLSEEEEEEEEEE